MERSSNHGFNEYRRTPTRGIRGRGRGGRGRGGGGEGGKPSRGRRSMNRARGRNFESRKRSQISNQNYQDKIILSISYEILKELISKDENEIINILSKYKDSSEIFANNANFIKEMTEIMVELLLKISKIYSDKASNTLYHILKNTNIKVYIKQRLEIEDYDNKNYLNFILNLILLNDKLIDKFTDDLIRIKSGEILDYVEIIKIKIDKGDYVENLSLSRDVVSNIEKLKEKEKHKKLTEFIEKEKEREKEINKKNINNIDINKIQIDYKNRDIYLTTQDLNENKEIKIAPHLKSGSYISYERYINTMFYLEYQDCYKDLKETMNYLQINKSINYMNNKELYQLSKEFSNIYFYLEGEIKGLEIDRDGAIIIIEFRTHYYKDIKFTKRMITGSLIILTDNNFENYLLTTVHFNPYVDKKINDNPKSKMWLPKFPFYRVKLSLININSQSISFLAKNRQHLQIFESKAYFESYVHIMKRLKEINIQYLPFKRELVEGDFHKLQKKDLYGNEYLKYNNMILCPHQKKYSREFINLFDKSQLNAIHNSLINRIALIQGPPGTGKTHVGTILTDIILQNMDDDAQILVVCFTNHALDSFIEDILKFTDSIVRIGGRCQNEKVAEYILDNKKKYSSKNYRNIANNLDALGEKMGDITSLIDSRRRVSIGLVKKYFELLYNRVIDDFFKIMNEAIPYEYKKDLKYNFKKDVIFREIYIFWNLIDNQINKKNTPDKIIKELLDSSNLENEKLLNNLYNKILNNFNGYDEDNLDVLKELNNTVNFEEENNEKIEINNPNKRQEEEEEEEDDEDDEDELAQNRERMNYLDYDIEEKKNNINIDDELYDENIDDLTNMKPLDSQKYNYLLKLDINFFKIGPKIIKLIINYMKEKLLSDIKNYEEDLYKFSYLLNKKKKF